MHSVPARLALLLGVSFYYHKHYLQHSDIAQEVAVVNLF